MENTNTTEEKKDNTEMSYRRPRFFVGSLIIILGLIILFGAFMIGGAFGRRTGMMRYERIGGVNNFGMMGNLNNSFGRMGMHTQGQRLLGSVATINGSTITVHNSSADTTVDIQSTTSFYKAGQVAKQSDLKVGDVITVRGLPNASGAVQATVVVIR